MAIFKNYMCGILKSGETLFLESFFKSHGKCIPLERKSGKELSLSHSEPWISTGYRNCNEKMIT